MTRLPPPPDLPPWTPRAALFPAIELKPYAPDGKAMYNELFPPLHLRDRVSNPSMVEVYWGQLCQGSSKSTPTVRGHCMRVLGELALYYPVEVGVDPVYEKGLLYSHCMNTFKADKSTNWLLSGALAGINGVLQAVRRRPHPPQTVSRLAYHPAVSHHSTSIGPD